MNIHRLPVFFLSLALSGALYGISEPQFTIKSLDANRAQIDCTIPLDHNEYLYTDKIDISIDQPSLNLETITLPTATERFDKRYKTTKQVAEGNPTISIIITKTSSQLVNNAHLRIIYYTNASSTPRESLFPITIWQQANEQTTLVTPESKEISAETTDIAPADNTSEQPEQRAATATSSWSTYISGLMKTSSALWLKLLLALLLGLLLSFTPCIYPMIPITMGILQAQGAKTIGQNFLLALTYTLGIATTFALLGLAASFAGVLFGSLLTHPIVICVIIALLLYIAFSLFGFYELYMPRSLSNRQVGPSKMGSYLTAFIFGAASGTVASPCLSPGIIFMLTLVASLNNLFLGFLLLFFFGLGLGLPLLIIGTFSSSISLLPRAGMWMNEIKYLFGFMMLGMAIYFLSALLPVLIIIILFVILTMVAGIFYLIQARRMAPGIGRGLYNLLGTLFIAASIVLIANGIKEHVFSATIQNGIEWHHDLSAAQEQARQLNKPLFIFVHATLCISCQEVEKELETSPAFKQAIKNNIAASINLSKATPAIKAFQQKYNIMGAPSCMIINPVDGSIIKRWDGELTPEQLEELIHALS